LLSVGPAENSAHPGKDFTQMKRFGNVVIGTSLKPRDTVNDIGFPRQHDDRNGRALPDMTRQRQTIFTGQGQIHEDQSNLLDSKNVSHLGTIRSFKHAKVFLFQVAAQHGPNLSIIVDN
jgi:hypothetical protein